MLWKGLYLLQEVRSVVFFGSLFILFLFVHMVMEQALLSHLISSYRRNSVMSHFWTTFILLYFFYHLFICRRQKKKKACDIKQNLFICIFLKFLFSLLSIFLSYLSLLLNPNKASKIIFKIQLFMWEKSTLHCIYTAIFVHVILLFLVKYGVKGATLMSASRRSFCRGCQGKYRGPCLNIKSCKPRQKHCRGKAEAKCIFI